MASEARHAAWEGHVVVWIDMLYAEFIAALSEGVYTGGES
jgi:hypothetical protein